MKFLRKKLPLNHLLFTIPFIVISFMFLIGCNPDDPQSTFGDKGPIAKQLKELGHKVSVTSIANFYRDFIDGIVIDHKDNSYIEEIESFGIMVKVCNIQMVNIQTKIEQEQILLPQW